MRTSLGIVTPGIKIGREEGGKQGRGESQHKDTRLHYEVGDLLLGPMGLLQPSGVEEKGGSM